MDNKENMKNKTTFIKITVLSFLLFITLTLISINPEKTSAAGVFDNNTGGAVTVTEDDFNAFNPLKSDTIARTPGSDADPNKLSTPGGIISRILEFSFPLAGLILFIMLFWGGFEILYGSSTSKSMEAGKNRITSAIIGFFLLFASFWIIQILEVVLGIKIIL